MLNRKTLISKIRDDRGESLVETIVAFLVITFVMVAFAAMVTFGFNLTTQAESLDHADTNMTGPVNVNYNTGYNTTYDKGTTTNPDGGA